MVTACTAAALKRVSWQTSCAELEGAGRPGAGSRAARIRTVSPVAPYTLAVTAPYTLAVMAFPAALTPEGTRFAAWVTYFPTSPTKASDAPFAPGKVRMTTAWLCPSCARQ
eukprot:TRINITY_DN13590_c0_g1_i1.p3 TRINITY_DN13590_c0_g1~~TRINITY_DN13590_c0_g1_i1.p3  ORF type:complete len:111 (-),score=4.89 TRINITY_DN13590_c0_g1_i1:143-475(-)